MRNDVEQCWIWLLPISISSEFDVYDALSLQSKNFVLPLLFICMPLKFRYMMVYNTHLHT